MVFGTFILFLQYIKEEKMDKKIAYLEWRNRTRTTIPDTHRIGEDILLVEDYEISQDYTEPFKLDITTAIIYEEGSVDVRINMKEYHVTAPAMVVMMTNQTFQYISTDSQPKVKAIVLSNKVLEGLFNDTHLPAVLYRSIYDNPVLELNEDDRYVLNLFYDMMHGLVKAPTGEYRIEAAKHLILTIFYGYMVKENNSNRIDDEPRNRATDLSDAFLELLRSDFRISRDVGHYADQLFVTPKYLSRCIKEVTGRTATEWIDSYVVNESKSLLASTRLTIQQISDQLGFLSTALFGKYFKRVEGITPSAYRKSRKG